MKYNVLVEKAREHFLATGDLETRFELTRPEVLDLLDNLREERLFYNILDSRTIKVGSYTVNWK